MDAADVWRQQIERLVDQFRGAVVVLLVDHVHLVEVDADGRVADVVEELPDRQRLVEERRRPRLDEQARVMQFDAVDHAQDNLPELVPAFVGVHVRMRSGEVIFGADGADQDDDTLGLHDVGLEEGGSQQRDPRLAQALVAHHQIRSEVRVADDQTQSARVLTELGGAIVGHVGKVHRAR